MKILIIWICSYKIRFICTSARSELLIELYISSRQDNRMLQRSVITCYIDVCMKNNSKCLTGMREKIK